MTLVQMLNQVLLQSGFLERSSFVSSADPDDKQMIAIANRVAQEIKNYFPWDILRKPFEITMQDGQIRYLLPNDFQSLVADSAWEVDGQRQVEWPVPSGRWFEYKFTNWSDGGTLRVRMYGNEIEIHDIEPGQSIEFEYVSKYPILSEAGEAKEFFTADDDTWVLDDQVLILGIQAHWMQTKLMPQYMEHFGNYNKKMSEYIGRSTGSRTIGGLGRYHGRGAPYYPLYRKS